VREPHTVEDGAPKGHKKESMRPIERIYGGQGVRAGRHHLTQVALPGGEQIAVTVEFLPTGIPRGAAAARGMAQP